MATLNFRIRGEDYVCYFFKLTRTTFLQPLIDWRRWWCQQGHRQRNTSQHTAFLRNKRRAPDANATS